MKYLRLYRPIVPVSIIRTRQNSDGRVALRRFNFDEGTKPMGKIETDTLVA